MKSNRSQVLPDGHRYPASTSRIVLLAFLTSCLYAAGLGSGAWAAILSLAAVRAGQSVPWAPWLMAFVFMVSGMLAVVYGFFFRPRAVEVNAEEVALVRWDGKGASLRRTEVDSVDTSGSRLILRGTGKTLSVPRMFNDWDRLRTELAGWKSAESAGG